MPDFPEHAGVPKAHRIKIVRCVAGCHVLIELRDADDQIFAVAPFDTEAVPDIVDHLIDTTEACVADLALAAKEGTSH